MKNYSYLYINKQTKGRDFLKSNKKMINQMTRKEAATIMKKYEVNGMVRNVTDEYINAKQIYKQRVEEEQKKLNDLMKMVDEIN